MDRRDSGEHGSGKRVQAREARYSSFKLWLRYAQSRPTGQSWWTRGPLGALREGGNRDEVGIVAVDGHVRRRRPQSKGPSGGVGSARGIANNRQRRSGARIRGMI